MSGQTRLEAFVAAVGADIKAVRAPYLFSMVDVLTTKVGAHRVYMETDCVVESVRIAVGTAPVGSSVIVDVNRNGTTIYTTQGNRPTIAISGFTALGGVAANNAFSIGDYMTVDVDQVGTANANLTVTVLIRKTD